MTQPPAIDDQTIALITERVVAGLRDELEAIAMSLLADNGSEPLTVGEVAERFGVARSTVYAHWPEWGGYTLSASGTDRRRWKRPQQRDRLGSRPNSVRKRPRNRTMSRSGTAACAKNCRIPGRL